MKETETKLISSNDEKGYTYLGRFLKKEDAFSIGYENFTENAQCVEMDY